MQRRRPGFKQRKARITEDSLKFLAQKGLNKKEAAQHFGVSEDTIQRAFADNESFRAAWDEGRSTITGRLRDLQWSHAQRPDSSGVTMTIHMSKHQLGEHERTFQKTEVSYNPIKELLAKIDGKTRGLPAHLQEQGTEHHPQLLPDQSLIPEDRE